MTSTHFNHSLVAEYLGSRFLIITNNAAKTSFILLFQHFLDTVPHPHFIICQAGMHLTTDGILPLLSAKWYLLC